MERVALILSFLALLIQPAAAQQSPQPISIGQKLTLHSKVLKEDRSYWINLPRSYDDSRLAKKSYPVLYLLDGNAYFETTSGVVGHLSSSAVLRIPEMIVVAIPNTKRTRDLTPTHMTEGPYSAMSGGAPQFLRFLKEELFPEIESRYRTLPHRTLVGHSLGGLFALHAFLESPEAFNSYVAIDPSLSWDDEVLVKKLNRSARDGLKRPASVFIALANSPDTYYGNDLPQKQRHEGAINRFSTGLKTKSSPRLRSQLQFFENEDHLSVPLVGLYQGLLFTFDGYLPAAGIFQIGPDALSAHFRAVSSRLGITLLPPEDLVNFRAQALRSTDPEKANAFLKMNAANYPRSPDLTAPVQGE